MFCGQLAELARDQDFQIMPLIIVLHLVGALQIMKDAQVVGVNGKNWTRLRRASNC